MIPSSSLWRRVAERGGDERSGSLFSYVDLEARVGKDHPLRVIRLIVNEALAALSGEFGFHGQRQRRASEDVVSHPCRGRRQVLAQCRASSAGSPTSEFLAHRALLVIPSIAYPYNFSACFWVMLLVRTVIRDVGRFTAQPVAMPPVGR